MLIRHSLVYIVAKLLPGLLGMVATALLTRLLSPESYGHYALALVIMTFGATVAFDWLGLTYLRMGGAEADRRRSEATFLALFAALTVATLAAGLVAGVTGLVLPEDRTIVGAGLLMMWSYAWFEFATRGHIAGLRPGIYLRMNAGRAVFSLLGACGLAALTHDAVWCACGTAAGTLLGACLGGMPLGARGGIDRDLARRALQFGLPLAASLALNSAIGAGTRALVGGIGGFEALGLYTAAFVLVQNSLTVISAGVASAGFSLAVRELNAGRPEAARAQLAANGRLLLAVLGPAAVGMAMSSGAIATTLVGAHYSAAVAVLTPWMAVGALLAGFRAHFLDHAFQLGQRMQGQVWVTAGAAVVTLGLGLILVPRLGPVGGAMAVAAGAAASCVQATVLGRRAFALPLPWAAGARVALACGAMAGCVSVMPGQGWVGLLTRIGSGVVVYGVCAVALNVVGLREVAVAWGKRLSARPEAA